MNKYRKFFRSCPYALLMGLVCIAFWIYKINDFDVNIGFLSNIGLFENVGSSSEADDTLDGISNDVSGASGSEMTSLNSAGTLDTAESVEAGMATGEAVISDATEAEPETESGAEPETAVANSGMAEIDAEANVYPYSLGQYSNGYVYYDPIETNSRYYTDEGRIALTTAADYVTASADYFDDACFIGDSRMVGIADYAGWNKAAFYCDNGYCLHSFITDKTVTCQNDGKKYTLAEALDRGTYGKIYIMLGINDCGYGDNDTFRTQYDQMLSLIMEKQPEAKIFILANLLISQNAEKEDKTGVYRNVNVNSKNAIASDFADGKKIFYLDYNQLFVDEAGYLKNDYTFDGFHVYAAQYIELAGFIANHAI